MAVPQRKKSKARRDTRRAQHDKITLPSVGICDNCGADVLSHRACSSCGHYNGRQAVALVDDALLDDELLDDEE